MAATAPILDTHKIADGLVEAVAEFVSVNGPHGNADATSFQKNMLEKIQKPSFCEMLDALKPDLKGKTNAELADFWTKMTRYKAALGRCKDEKEAAALAKSFDASTVEAWKRFDAFMRKFAEEAAGDTRKTLESIALHADVNIAEQVDSTLLRNGAFLDTFYEHREGLKELTSPEGIGQLTAALEEKAQSLTERIEKAAERIAAENEAFLKGMGKAAESKVEYRYLSSGGGITVVEKAPTFEKMVESHGGKLAFSAVALVTAGAILHKVMQQDQSR